MGLTSAAGLVGFLSESSAELQVFALQRLNEEIDPVWTEVSGSIGQMYVSWKMPGAVQMSNRRAEETV